MFKLLKSFRYVVLALLILGVPHISVASEVPPQLVEFLKQRDQIAQNLIEVISECVDRTDTEFSVFHGCIDWHSAVHATWAILAYSKYVDSVRFHSWIQARLNRRDLDKEMTYLRAHPRFEMPYGRAWFLRLAIEYKHLQGTNDLSAFAGEVATSLIDYYESEPPMPRSESYDSASWALLNLFDYALAYEDKSLQERVAKLINTNFERTPFPCPSFEDESKSGSFMAICTNWAALVGRTSAKQEFQLWVDQFLPVSRLLPPVTKPSQPHNFGTNFSRAWGLWSAYWATNEPGYLKSYLAHFNQTYKSQSWWKGDYATVGHWVAQFGMFALISTYYDIPADK